MMRLDSEFALDALYLRLLSIANKPFNSFVLAHIDH